MAPPGQGQQPDRQLAASPSLLVLKANTKWESVLKTLESHLAPSRIPATFLLLCSLLLQVPFSQKPNPYLFLLMYTHTHTHTHTHSHLHTHSPDWVSSHLSIFLMVDTDCEHLLKYNNVPSIILNTFHGILHLPLKISYGKPNGKSTLNIHWKDWCWSWNSNTLATRCKEPAHWKTSWYWEGLKAKEEGDSRGWDG